MTEACSAGNLTDCSCDSSREGDTAPDGWKWGGCSDNVQYGLWFAESFVDAPDRDRQRRNGVRDVRVLMNLHNNEVGRKVRNKIFLCLGAVLEWGLLAKSPNVRQLFP